MTTAKWKELVSNPTKPPVEVSDKLLEVRKVEALERIAHALTGIDTSLGTIDRSLRVIQTR